MKRNDAISEHEKRKKEILEWDPDYIKVTPEEAQHIEAAEKSGYVDSDDVDWSNVGSDEEADERFCEQLVSEYESADDKNQFVSLSEMMEMCGITESEITTGSNVSDDIKEGVRQAIEHERGKLEARKSVLEADEK